MRGICAEAGLATRYFYESFADREEFIAAVFDWVVATLAGSTQAAVAAAPAMEQTRAGMSTIVLSIESDPRIGRLMFTPAVQRHRDAQAGGVQRALRNAVRAACGDRATAAAPASESRPAHSSSSAA